VNNVSPQSPLEYGKVQSSVAWNYQPLQVSQIQTDLTLLRSTQTKNQTEKTLHGGNKTKESRMPRDFFGQTPE